jgi:hypothetical protein
MRVGRLLLRIEALEERLASREYGATESSRFAVDRDFLGRSWADLKAGVKAPAFLLPLLGGGETALDDWLGERWLLIRLHSRSSRGVQLLAWLELFHQQVPLPRLMVVCDGDESAIKSLVSQLGITLPVALASDGKPSDIDRTEQSSCGYVLDELGIVAMQAEGADDVISLILGAADVGPALGETMELAGDPDSPVPQQRVTSSRTRRAQVRQAGDPKLPCSFSA